MQYQIINSENTPTIIWAGGTSTELFIFPLKSDYKLRNFNFRISTATVEIEQSDFTALPGFSRIILILDGEITITHNHQDSKWLKKFDVHEFDGCWITSSVGLCTDFNLMTNDEYSGKLAALTIEQNQVVNYAINESLDWLVIYVYKGKISVTLNGNIELINQGCFVVLSDAISSLLIESIEYSELIFTEISVDQVN